MTSLRIYDPIDFDEWLPEQLSTPSATPLRNGNGQITNGQRNNTLLSLAGSMRRRGMSQAAIEAALLVENTETCIPPLSEEEVRRIAKSIMRYPPVTPGYWRPEQKLKPTGPCFSPNMGFIPTSAE